MPAAIYRAARSPVPPHFPFYPFHCPTSLRYGVQVLSISLSLLVWVLVYCVLFFSREVDRSSFKICRRLLLINSSSFIVITLFRPTPYIHSNRSAIGLAYAVRCVTYCVLVCLRAWRWYVVAKHLNETNSEVLWWLRLFVYLSVCLSASIFPELHVRSSPKLSCLLPEAMTLSSSGGAAICSDFPALWMT